MKITNKYNLPEYVIRLLSERYKPKPETIGVTSLIDSPRIRTLQIEKWDEIEYDVSYGLTALGGLSLHQRAEFFAENDEQAEKRLEDSKDSKGLPLGLTVVGKADNYLKEFYKIRDWKSMAVYGLKWPDKIKKIIQQLNIYAWQRAIRGQQVQYLYIDIYWKNWKYENWERASDKIYNVFFDLTNGGVIAGYPPIAYSQVKLPLWSFEQQEQLIKDLIEYHLMGSMECSDRWQQEPEFAIMKQGRKSAIRVFDTYNECFDYCFKNNLTFELGLKEGISIIERPGKMVRCQEFYCPVYSICKGEK